jgi:hypothetical protein
MLPLVCRLMEHRRGSEGRLLTDGTTRGARGGAGARRPFSRESLPTNLHAMSLSQLRAVCAAHGFTPKAGTAAGVVKVRHSHTPLLADPTHPFG